jgi:hypothetical protein
MAAEEGGPPAGQHMEEKLISASGRSLSVIRMEGRGSKISFLERFSFPDSVSAEAERERRNQWKNALSLNYHPAFINPLEIKAEEDTLTIVYEGLEGVHLPEYLRDYFNGYPAEEGFALEVLFTVVEIVRSLMAQSARSVIIEKIGPDDIFIARDGRLKLIPPRLHFSDEKEKFKDSQAHFIRGLAELLFFMLTLEDPLKKGEFLSQAREVNREMTLYAESVIRRCAAGDKEGGFNNLLTLRQALYEELKRRSAGKPVKDGYIRNFKSEKPVVEYEEHMEEAVKQEEKFQQKVRKGDWGWDYRFLVGLFRDVNRQFNWKRLWPLFIFPYILVILPFILITDMRYAADIVWLLVYTFPVYVGVFLIILHGYRRPLK